MRYRNTATGNVIETACAINGNNWQPLEAAGDAPGKTAKAEPQTGEGDYDIDDDSDLEVDAAPIKAKGKKK